MFRSFIYILMGVGFGFKANAQIDAYYRPQKRLNDAFLLNHPDLIKVKSYWYMGIEGGGKWNGSTLSNSFSGLLNYKKSFTDSYAGGHIAYSHNLRWVLETGYIRNPSNFVLIVNTNRPLQFRINELQHSIPLRFKWRVLRVGNVQKKSGIYVGGGFLWTPTRKRKELDSFRLTGFTRSAGSRTQFDTLLVQNFSFTTGRAKIELEGSVEFVGRVSNHFELVSFGRVSFAGASALSSNSELFLNRASQSVSVLTLRPVSYHFGVAIRYIYSLKNSYYSSFEE